MEQNELTNQTVQDPVCGMNVVPGRARGWDYLYQKVLYHFCGPDCRSRFQRDPKGILSFGPGQPRVVPAPSGADEGKTWWSTLRRLIK